MRGSAGVAIHVAAILAGVVMVSVAKLQAWPGRPASQPTPTVTALNHREPAHWPKPRSPVGTNLAPICDWSTERPFADLFKQSRPWFSNTEATWDDQRPVNVDTKGWVRSLAVGQRARSLVVWGVPFPSGDIVVTWRGTGTLDFWPQEASQMSPGRAVIHADPSRGGLAVTITRTDPSNPIRDIHMWPIGLEGQLFHPDFLRSLAPYGALRFMDWMVTNASVVTSWEERPLPEDARWSVKGVPLEIMVDLANATDADPWLTIPHTWNAHAIQHAAVLVHQRMESTRRVWLEHSNEVWNSIFPQAEEMRRRGMSHQRAADPFEAQLREHAVRSRDIFRAWGQVFSSDTHRLVRVLGSMAANPWVTEILVNEVGVAEHTDAVAIAPYFGGALGDEQNADVTRTMGLTQVFGLLETSMNASLRDVKAHHLLTARHGLMLVAYEGGQHLVGLGDHLNDSDLHALFLSVNRDPRLQRLYTRYLQGWREAGGTLFMHYLDVAAPSIHGVWGARESLNPNDSPSPKWNALRTFAESTQVWWGG